MNFGVNGQIAVAISKTPLGPFVVVNTALNITRGSSGKPFNVYVNKHYRYSETFAYFYHLSCAKTLYFQTKYRYFFRFLGDFDILVDSDGSGYIIYSSNSMNVEKLTADYYHTTNSAPYVFPETFVEAPVLMKKDGTYYALYDWCCCYCFQGSGIMVYRADSPLGPYTQQVSLAFFL